jgi:hypothetical protein
MNDLAREDLDRLCSYVFQNEQEDFAEMLMENPQAFPGLSGIELDELQSLDWGCEDFIDLLDKAINFVSTPAGSAIVSGAGNIVGGIAAGEAAKEAAQTQAASADAATQLQRDIYNKFMEMNKPYYEAGVNALGQITRGEVTAEPGYGFRLGEGMKALERLQASRGNLLSGGALKAGQRFAQDTASQEYGNAYNRLARLADVGPQAAGVMSTLGQNYANNVGNITMGQGNTTANALLSSGSAYQRSAGDIASLYARMYGPQPTYGG